MFSSYNTNLQFIRMPFVLRYSLILLKSAMFQTDKSNSFYLSFYSSSDYLLSVINFLNSCQSHVLWSSKDYDDFFVVINSDNSKFERSIISVKGRTDGKRNLR